MRGIALSWHAPAHPDRCSWGLRVCAGVRSAGVSIRDAGLLILGCGESKLLSHCPENGCVLLLFTLTTLGFVLKCLIFWW